MNFLSKILHLFGWKIEIKINLPAKCVICVAPHTSNLDFILGIIAWYSLGRSACFLMKKQWFFWPLGILLKRMGGIAVSRGKKSGISTKMIDLFNKRDKLTLAVTPEGTRSATTNWKTGFLHIANEAKVPILLGVIDFKNKQVRLNDEFNPTGNIESDLSEVKNYYANMGKFAKYPDKFSV